MASTRSNMISLRAASLVYLASLSSALPALGEFKYQGCYTDNGSQNQRSLAGKKVLDPKMTLAMCAAACQAYQWFGVEYGSQCYCGTSLASMAEKRPETECSMKCAGNHCQLCGAGDRLSVFWTGRDTTGSNLDTIGGFRYQSCWTDDAQARSLTGSENPRSGMTVEMCADFCKDYKYFGVESSSECFCGNELSGGEVAPEEECSELCAGNSTEWCGGQRRMNLYVATGPSTTTEPSAASTTTVPDETTTVPDETTTMPDQTTTAPDETTTTTLIAPETTTTEEPPTVETSTTEEVPTPTPTLTLMPTITPTDTLPSSTTLAPSTTACPEMTTRIIQNPSTCFPGMPSACASLTRSPALPVQVASIAASQCQGGYLAGTTYPPEIASCFTGIGRPSFVATSAYSCASSAPVYCETATVCAGGPAPQPTNVLGDDGGFENGELWPVRSSSGTDDVFRASLATDIVHSGAYSLRADFSNTSGGSRLYLKTVWLLPGATYEAAWWWYSTNAAAATTSRMQLQSAGSSVFVHDEPTKNQPVGQWIRASQIFTAPSTMTNVLFTVYGNMENAANTFYVDDISITQVV